MSKILVVDDEKALAKALSLKLSSAGFDVTTACNGEEALELLEKETFALMLLDLVMPKVDGFQVLEALSKKKSHLKIIVTSNLGQEEDATKAVSLGAIHYFVKSETPLTEIVEYIQKTL